MTLDVKRPAPPSLETDADVSEYDDVDVQGDEYRRDELQAFLENGAWETAFEQWAADTRMSEPEFDIARDLGLFSQFDFFWDDFADRVGYHAPGIPEDWQEREYHPGLESWSEVSSINASLTEFGQLVCETLKDDYIDWDADYEPPDDLPDFG
jgi:hypothetical protein